MHPTNAVEIATDALIWLAGRPEAIEALMAASGSAPETLRQRAADPVFLGFVLDFLLSSEALVVAFAADAGVDPGLPARARAALPGGDVHAWT